MKKAFYIFAAVSAIVLAAACAKEQQPEQVTPIEPQEEELVTYTFTASAQSEVVEDGDEEVRSTLSNGGAFTWAVDDQFKIWNTSTNSYVTFSVTEINGDGTVHISGTAAAGAVWGNAIYPASRAAGSGNTVDYTSTTTAGPILVGRVDGQVIYFYYLGAVMNITVNSVPDTPVSLTVTANSNVFGSRTFSWVENKPVLGGSGSQASVTVPFNASGITSVPVPNVSYAGFTITVDNAAGRHLYKKATANTFDLTSKKLLPMPALTYAAPEIYYMRTTDTRGGNFWSCDIPLIKTGADAHYALANVDKTATYLIFDEYNKVDPGTAVPSAAILKSGNVLDLTYSANSFSLVGVDSDWTLGNHSAYAFSRIGNWDYLLNQSGLHNKSFKFNPWDNTTDWNAVWGSTGGAWFNDSVKEVTIFQNSGDGTNCGLYLENTTVNLFLNTTTAKAYYREASDKNNPISALAAFTYTPSTNTLSTSTEDEWGVVNPFNDPDYPTTEYLFLTDMDDWAKTHTMSYNNWCWTCTFDVAETGIYNFDIATSTWGYKVAPSTTWHTADVAANGYGRLSYWDTTGDATVTLSKGTYKVFLNPTYAHDHSLNVQFVKQ